jgi:hypothetical protein
VCLSSRARFSASARLRRTRSPRSSCIRCRVSSSSPKGHRDDRFKEPDHRSASWLHAAIWPISWDGRDSDLRMASMVPEMAVKAA